MPTSGNKKISEFSLATSLTNNDVLPIVNSGDTKKITLSGLSNFFKTNLTTTGLTVNGNLSVTGNTVLNIFTANTVSANTANITNLTSGTVSATTYLNVSKYKVFTTLLSQSSSGTTYTADSQSSNFIVGQTYTIDNYISGDDFTNVGASSNQTGLKFIATGITASTWTGNSIVSYNSGTPVANILENTLPFSLYFSRGNTGTYATNTFSSNYKVAVFGTNSVNSTIVSFGIYSAGPYNNYIQITTQDLSGYTVDSKLSNTFLEIRVYN